MLSSFKLKSPLLSKFANKYFEIFFVIYLVSGVLKGIYISNGGFMPIDFTLVSGIVLIGMWGIIILSEDNLASVFRKLRRTIYLFIFYFIALITAFYSPSEKYSLLKLVLFLTNILAILTPCIHPNFNTQKFIKSFAGVTILVGIYSFVVYGFYFGTEGNILGLAQKFYYSFYLEAGYLIGLGLILTLKLPNSIPKFLTLNLLAILQWSSAARGPIIFTIVSLLIYISAYAFDKGTNGLIQQLKNRWKLIFAVISVNTIIISLIYSTTIGSVVFNRTLYRFSVIVPSEIEQTMLNAQKNANLIGGQHSEVEEYLPSQSNIDRIDHFIYSWNMINKTWRSQFFGYGFGSYGIIKTGYDTRLYPHNIFLEIWFETGLMGLIPFIIFIIQALFWSLKNNQHILGIAILYLFANTFKSYSLVDHRILMGILGIAIFIKAKLPAFNWLILEKNNSE